MNSSRLSVVSEIAQVVSALAVVVSLVYVGYEIRQNTGATRAATRQAVAETDLAFVGGPLDPALLARAEAKWNRHLAIISSRLRESPHAAAMWEANSWSFTTSFRSVVDSISRTLRDP